VATAMFYFIIEIGRSICVCQLYEAEHIFGVIIEIVIIICSRSRAEGAININHLRIVARLGKWADSHGKSDWK
jgi:hypothetical protein